MIITYVKIVNYLRKNHFDILHCHLLNTIGAIIARLAGIQHVITTIHSDTKYTIIEKFGLGKNHTVIACGEKVANNIERFIKQKKIRLLSNAIAIPPPNKIQQRLLNYDISQKTVLMSIGSLTKHKGFDLLLKAVHEAKKKYPAIILFIAGEGNERYFLEEIINKFNLKDYVYLLGNVKDVHRILSLVDIYINSSKREGLPMTLLEAMAHGIPIIATNVGGNKEVVINEKTGLLVKANESALISQAICRLVSDLPLRKYLGNNAFDLFQEKYTIDKHCLKLSKIYCK